MAKLETMKRILNLMSRALLLFATNMLLLVFLLTLFGVFEVEPFFSTAFYPVYGGSVLVSLFILVLLSGRSLPVRLAAIAILAALTIWITFNTITDGAAAHHHRLTVVIATVVTYLLSLQHAWFPARQREIRKEPAA
jgi:hypothetical protein